MRWINKENEYCNRIKAHLTALLPDENIEAGVAITIEGEITRAIGIREDIYILDRLFSPSASVSEIADGICKKFKEKDRSKQK